jgi:hypothetical protein
MSKSSAMYWKEILSGSVGIKAHIYNNVIVRGSKGANDLRITCTLKRSGKMSVGIILLGIFFCILLLNVVYKRSF